MLIGSKLGSPAPSQVGPRPARSRTSQPPPARHRARLPSAGFSGVAPGGNSAAPSGSGFEGAERPLHPHTSEARDRFPCLAATAAGKSGGASETAGTHGSPSIPEAPQRASLGGSHPLPLAPARGAAGGFLSPPCLPARAVDLGLFNLIVTARFGVGETASQNLVQLAGEFLLKTEPEREGPRVRSPGGARG